MSHVIAEPGRPKRTDRDCNRPGFNRLGPHTIKQLQRNRNLLLAESNQVNLSRFTCPNQQLGKDDLKAAVAWSGSLTPEFRTDIQLKTFFGRGSGESIQMQFNGEGFVVIQPKEEVYFQGK